MVIGICDDEKNVRNLVETYIGNIDDSETIFHFRNGDEVLRYVRQGKKLDILYLDIDLKDSPDGMEVASKIKKRQIKEGSGASALPLIIFITGLPERMPEAFGVRAFQFLVKPIQENQFKTVFYQAKKAVEYAPKIKRGRSISVCSNGVKRTISIAEIYFIESSGRKLIFHLRDERVEIYGKMADIYEELDDSFCQIHRSFIVNMRFITDYTRTEVQTDSGVRVSMSKYKYRDFVREYALYLENSEL